MTTHLIYKLGSTLYLVVDTLSKTHVDEIRLYFDKNTQNEVFNSVDAQIFTIPEDNDHTMTQIWQEKVSMQTYQILSQSQEKTNYLQFSTLGVESWYFMI